MRKAILPIILVLLSVMVLLPGCASGNVFNLGGTVTEKKDFANFTEVEIDGAFQIDIAQANSFTVTINADKNLLDYVTTTKEGNVLKIYLDPHHPFTDFTVLSKAFKASITMPTLTGLRLSGASRVTVTGFKLPQNSLNLRTAGSNTLRLEGIETNEANFDVSGSSTVTGDVKAVTAKFDVAGSSRVDLTGSANTTTLNTSGASKLNLIDFPVTVADVTLSGVSEATLDIKEKLDFDLTDASTLYFQGNPTIGNMSVSGASTIKHK